MRGRADIAQRRMATLPIVERFNVKENVGACLRTGFVENMMHQFRFQAAKKALSWGIVVTIACTAHTRLKVVVL